MTLDDFSATTKTQTTEVFCYQVAKTEGTIQLVAVQPSSMKAIGYLLGVPLKDGLYLATISTECGEEKEDQQTALALLRKVQDYDFIFAAV